MGGFRVAEDFGNWNFKNFKIKVIDSGHKYSHLNDKNVFFHKLLAKMIVK